MLNFKIMIETLAILSCAIFAGASVYISLVEHPVRLTFDPESALAQWKPSYKRAAIMQVSLAVMGFLFCLVAWLLENKIRWLISGLILIMVIPYTLIIMMPINQRLFLIHEPKQFKDVPRLLKNWGKLHLVRILLSIIALIVMVPYT